MDWDRETRDNPAHIMPFDILDSTKVIYGDKDVLEQLDKYIE